MKLLRRHPGKPKTRRLLLCAALLVPALARAAGPPNLLRAEDFRHYVDALNQNDAEDVNSFLISFEAEARNRSRSRVGKPVLFGTTSRHGTFICGGTKRRYGQ